MQAAESNGWGSAPPAVDKGRRQGRSYSSLEASGGSTAIRRLLTDVSEKLIARGWEGSCMVKYVASTTTVVCGGDGGTEEGNAKREVQRRTDRGRARNRLHSLQHFQLLARRLRLSIICYIRSKSHLQSSPRPIPSSHVRPNQISTFFPSTHSFYSPSLSLSPSPSTTTSSTRSSSTASSAVPLRTAPRPAW